jgi:hypothetical protein
MATKKSLPESERAWLKVLGTMNEAQARLCVAQKALELGRGGISHLSALTGMSRPTITKGIAELKGQQPAAVLGAGARVRRAGGGRNKVEQADAALLKQLQRIVEETTAGDPMSALKWTAKSTRAIAAELGRRGHRVSHMTVARCLHELDYSLQANRKSRRRRAACRPRCTVSLSQPPGARLCRGGRPGGLGGHQEEGTGGGLS